MNQSKVKLIVELLRERAVPHAVYQSLSNPDDFCVVYQWNTKEYVVTHKTLIVDLHFLTEDES